MMAGRFVQIVHFRLLSHGLSGWNIIHTMSVCSVYLPIFMYVHVCELDCHGFLFLIDWFRFGKNGRESLAG